MLQIITSLQKRVENAFEMMKVITEDFAVDQNVVKKTVANFRRKGLRRLFMAA